MTQDDKLNMVENMRRYGGPFVKALAECFILADKDNFQRLLDAFPEYVETYSKIVDRRKK